MASRFKAYYRLAKPGIIYGNALTVFAGYLFASGLYVHFQTLGAVLLGTCLVIASACVCNNYTDRGIDIHMSRTKTRALVQGSIKPAYALFYASILGALGFVILATWTNLLVVGIGVVGFVDYVIVYAVSKRRWASGTLIGSISGATPILAGYCAYANRVDTSALILFILMVLWQMPHFYAIALYRKADYRSANIPVLPIAKGNSRTVHSIVTYCLAYSIAITSLSFIGHAGYFFIIVMLPVSLWWLSLALQGYKQKNTVAWARKVFFKSLIVLSVFSMMVSLGQILS